MRHSWNRTRENRVSEYIGGWLIDEENREALIASASPVPELEGLYSAPLKLDPRELFPQHRWAEQQGQQGACGGHGCTNVVEFCYGIATHGEPPHLSRQAAYIAAQRESGITGDRGSTIHGNVKVATEKGIPPESLWPYPGRYVTNPPVPWDQLWKAAEPFRVAKHSVLRSYDQVFNWLAAGTGGLLIGIRWSLPNASICESYRAGGGGHAIALLGFTERKDRSGRNYVLLLNSWGMTWGNNGWCEVAPAAIESMLRDQYTVMIGMTDMVNVVPRPIDWAKNSPYFE